MKCDARTQIIVEETARGNVAITVYIISAVLFVCWLIVQICVFNTYLINRSTLPLLGGNPTADGILYFLFEVLIIAVAGVVIACCSCCISEDVKNVRRRLATYDRMIEAANREEAKKTK
jgi:hypothetical protein